MLKEKRAIDDDENDPRHGFSRFALSAGHRTKDDDDDDPELPPQRAAKLVVAIGGFNLDATRTVKQADFDARELLCLHLLRAPLALERLSIDENGHARCALRKPDRHGHTAIVPTSSWATSVRSFPLPASASDELSACSRRDKTS